MTYTQCLAHLRRCLVVFGGLSQSSAAVSLHSLKTTMLSWGLQLSLPEPDRGAQGHHHCPVLGVSKCVPREWQLRCQRQVVDAIDREWVPYVSVDRRLHFLQLETTCSAPATPVILSPMSQDVVAENLRDPLEVNSDAPTEPDSESEAETA